MKKYKKLIRELRANLNLVSLVDEEIHWSDHDGKIEIYDPSLTESEYFVDEYSERDFSEDTELDDLMPPAIADQSSMRAGDNIPQYMLLESGKDFGIILGKKKGGDDNCCVGIPQGTDGHVLIIGGSGTGKTSCIIKPTFDNLTASFFAVDIDGELKAHLDTLAPRKPYKALMLTESTFEYTYDPLSLLRNDKYNIVQHARELCNCLIPLPVSTKDPFWIQSARDILTAAILLFFDYQKSFVDVMTSIKRLPLEDLIDEICNSGSETAQLLVSQYSNIRNLGNIKMLANIGQIISNAISVFIIDPKIKAAFTTTNSCITWDDLQTHNILLCIPESKLGQWDCVLTLVLTQLIRALERLPNKYSSEGKTIPPIILFFDEFPRLGKIEVIKNAVSTLRKKGITVCIVIQSIAQLDAIYGRDERCILVDNCPYNAILGATDPDTQKYLSEMVGSITVPVSSVSTNLDLNGRPVGYGMQKSESLRPLIFPHEFAALKDIILRTPEGVFRVDKSPIYNIASTKGAEDNANS